MALTEANLLDVARQLGPEWKQLATHLGFTQANIYHYKEDHSGEIVNAIHRMLCDWLRRQEGLDKLISCLQLCGRQDIVDTLRTGVQANQDASEKKKNTGGCEEHPEACKKQRVDKEDTGGREHGEERTECSFSAGLEIGALDVTLCQQQLKEHYLQILCKIPQYPGDTETCIDMNEIYTNLSILYDMSKPCSPIKIPLTSHHEIFTRKVNGMLPNKILVLGRGGSGKSTLIAKIAYDWATGVAGSPLKDIPLLFVLNMRWMQHDTDLEDAIFHQLLPEDTKISKESLLRYIKCNPSSVMILLDSYDEFSRGQKLGSCETSSILKILSNRCLTSCRVLVTSRRWRESDFSGLQKFYAKIDVNGFSEENVRGYVMKYFDDDKDSGERLCKYIEANSLFEIASFPLMAQLICLFWKETEEENIPTKTGELFTSIFNILYNHRLAKGMSSDSLDLDDMIVRLGKVAFFGLWPPENRLVFPLKEVEEKTSVQCVEDGCKTGIISMENKPSKYKVLKRAIEKGNKSIVFFHKSGQEKCAGDYLAHLAETNTNELKAQLEKLDSAKTCLSVQMVLRFASGSSDKAADLILQRLTAIARAQMKTSIQGYYEDSLDDADKVKTVQEFIELCLLCNYESGATGQFNGYLSDLFPIKTLQFLGMSPYTSMAIGHYLNWIGDRSKITTLKLIQLPRAGDVPRLGTTTSVVDKVYLAAQTDLRNKSEEEIRNLHAEYIERHKNKIDMDKFEKNVGIRYSFGLSFIELWEYFKTWHSAKSEMNLDPILDAVHCVALRRLDLSYVKLRGRGQKLVAIIDRGNLSSITHLILNDTGLGTEHMDHLVTLVKTNTPNLQDLDISSNYAGNGSVVSKLAQSLPALSIQELKVWKMSAPIADMTALAQKLPEFSTHLRVLDMGGNNTDDETGKTLVNTLPYAKHLKHLRMNVDGMRQETHKRVVLTTRQLTQLSVLKIGDSSYPNDLVACIADVMPSLPDLTHLALHVRSRGDQADLPTTVISPVKKLLSRFKGAMGSPRKTCEQSFICSLEPRAAKMIRLSLWEIRLCEADLKDLLDLCRKHDIQLGYRRRLWPEGMAIPEDINLELR